MLLFKRTTADSPFFFYHGVTVGVGVGVTVGVTVGVAVGVGVGVAVGSCAIFPLLLLVTEASSPVAEVLEITTRM